MRLTIEHATRYAYEIPPRAVIEVLRLTPASTANQTVRKWRIDVTGDATLKRGEDAFGNITHTFTVREPGEALAVVATGVVETEYTNGIVSGTRERLPLGLFLRPTALTEADAAIRDLAAAARAGSDGSALDTAHRLNLAVHEALSYARGVTVASTPAAEALAAGKGVCQDLAHVLLAAARAAGLPARYVSGYRYDDTRPRDGHDPHAWAEISVSGYGWISFDPSVGACATNAYVRVAVGLDSLSASPLRGSTDGAGGETLDVTVTIDASGWHGAADEMTQSLGPGMTQSLGPGMNQTAGPGATQTAGPGTSQTLGGATQVLPTLGGRQD